MVKRSKRDIAASKGKAEVTNGLFRLQEEAGLTDIEMLQVLMEFQQGALKYMLRFERHGDYENPAGLEKEE